MGCIFIQLTVEQYSVCFTYTIMDCIFMLYVFWKRVIFLQDNFIITLLLCQHPCIICLWWHCVVVMCIRFEIRQPLFECHSYHLQIEYNLRQITCPLSVSSFSSFWQHSSLSKPAVECLAHSNPSVSQRYYGLFNLCLPILLFGFCATCVPTVVLPYCLLSCCSCPVTDSPCTISRREEQIVSSTAVTSTSVVQVEPQACFAGSHPAHWRHRKAALWFLKVEVLAFVHTWRHCCVWLLVSGKDTAGE